MDTKSIIFFWRLPRAFMRKGISLVTSFPLMLLSETNALAVEAKLILVISL